MFQASIFFIFWTECGKAREMTTIQNGLKILEIPENDGRTVRGKEKTQKEKKGA